VAPFTVVVPEPPRLRVPEPVRSVPSYVVPVPTCSVPEPMVTMPPDSEIGDVLVPAPVGPELTAVELPLAPDPFNVRLPPLTLVLVITTFGLATVTPKSVARLVRKVVKASSSVVVTVTGCTA
jgi:hypothetical protein